MKKSIFLFLTAGLITSCAKEGCNDPAATNYDEEVKKSDGSCIYPTMDISFHFHLTQNGTDVSLNEKLTDDFNNTFQIARLDFYIAQPYMLNQNESPRWSSQEHHLITGPGHYEITQDIVEEKEHWQNLHFGIGVTEDYNYTNPTDYDTTNDLSPQSPSMHWNWNSGYRFIVIEGLVDYDGDQVLDSAFQYHIGAETLYREIMIPVNENIDVGENKMLSFNIDVAKVFEGIDIKNNQKTHTNNYYSLAETVANNFANSISKRIEE